jgi:ABC-type Fe3+ transport system permease subunit
MDAAARRDRGNVWSALVVGVILALIVVNDAVNAVLRLFSTPGATTVVIPFGPQDVTLENGVDAVVAAAQVTASGVDPVAVGCLVFSIVFPALVALAGIALGIALCIRVLRGQVFNKENTQALLLVSLALIVTPIVTGWFRSMGIDGVVEALDAAFGMPWRIYETGIPLVVIGIALFVLVAAFRRGERLQRDTEGLV